MPKPITLMVAAGCLGLAREAPAKRTYALELVRPPGDVRRTDNTVLAVEPFRVAPRFAGRAFERVAQEATSR